MNDIVGCQVHQLSLPRPPDPEVLILPTCQLDLLHNFNSGNAVQTAEGQEGDVLHLVHGADPILVLDDCVGRLNREKMEGEK